MPVESQVIKTPAEQKGFLEPDATSLTFAGMVPTDTPLPSGELSIEDPAPEQEKLSIVDRGERPAVLGPENDQRTAKVQFALGEKAPSPEVTSNALATGQEASLRESVAAQKDAEDQANKIEVIKQAAADGSLSKWDPQLVENIIRSTPKNNPATVFEKAFAKAYIGLIPQMGNPQESVVTEAIKHDVGHVATMAEIAETLTTKQEIAKSAAEDFAAMAKEQSWSGWFVDKSKTLASFGLYDWYKTYSAATPVDGVLKGNNWAEQIQYLYTLPPSQMHSELRRTLDTISQDNPSLASEFADAVVSFSGTQQFLTNLGNVIDVALFPPVGRLTKSGFAVAKAIASRGEKEAAKESATVAYQAAVAANVSPKSDIASSMAKMGDVGGSATINATKRLDEILTGKDIPLLPGEAQKRLSSLFNPAAIGDDSSFSALTTQRLISKLSANASAVQDRIRDLEKVTRLPGEAEKLAIEEMKTSLADRFSHPNNAVVDMAFEITPSEVHPSNVTHVAALIGEKSGEGFDSQYAAWRYAKSLYKIHDNDIKIEQRGVKYFIRVERPIDETTSAVRQNLTIETSTQTPQGLVHSYFGWLGSGNSRVSQEQIENRIVAASGSSALVTMMKDMAKPIGSLSKGEYKRLIRVMEDNRSTIDPFTKEAGTFHNNIAELDRAYQRLFGQSVSEKEASAYFSAVQLNDVDYTMRNLGLYRDRARQGIETWNVVDKVDKGGGKVYFPKSGDFLGKELDHLPIDAARENPATVAIHRLGQEPEVMDMSMLNTPERKAYIKSLQDEGYKVIQTYNPSRTVLDKFGKDNINFIITKDFERRGLDPVQLPYRPGWHQEYQQQWYTKQAQIKQVERPTKDTSQFGDVGKPITLQEGKDTHIQYMRNKEGGQEFGNQVSYVPLNDRNYDKYKVSSKSYQDYLNEVAKPENLGYRPTMLEIQGGKLSNVGTAESFSKYLNEGQRANWRRSVYDHGSPEAVQFGKIADSEGLPLRSTSVKHFYEGDTTAMGHTTEAEAKMWSSKWERARQILNGEAAGDLGDYLRKELPLFSEQRFKALFEATDKEPARFLKDVPFTHTYTGKTTTDMAGHGDLLKAKFSNFYDDIRSPWNLMANENKKFVGQRDDVLWTTKNIGTEANPVFQLADAPMIDPMSSLSRGMYDVMRNRFMVDYKTSAMEQWISEFGDLLKGPASKEDLWGNAVTHLHNGNFVTSDPSNYNRLMAAKQSRAALLEFLGTESPDKMAMNNLRQKIANVIYEQGSKLVGPNIAEATNLRLLAQSNDPYRIMQGFAFHTSFFLNAFQGLQNAMVMANALALGGLKSGLPGFKAGWGMQMLRYNATDAGLEAVAKVSGWEKQWVKEAWEGLQSTGRMFVEGEHAWKDDLADPKFFQGILGNVLDHGQVFFREGERIGRMTAWATAYHEWRIANPEAAFNAAVKAKVLARSDDMTVNMTRASKATWQQGLFAIPTQFWAWNARNMELMVGRWQNGLSVSDRAKLVGMNSLLYGVPLGSVAPAVGGFWNPWESTRQYLVDKGWDVNDKVFDSLYSGLVGMGYHLATGRPGNANETLGLGGSNLIRDAFDDHKTLVDWALGVSGSRTGDAITSAKPFVRALAAAITGDSEKFKLTSNDFIDVARNMKIVDTGIKNYYAWTTGKYITKNGVYLGDLSKTEAVFNLFTNALPRKLNDPKVMEDVNKARQDAIKHGSKELQKNYTAAIVAALNNDSELHDVYMKRVATLSKMMDLRPDEQKAIMGKLFDEVTPKATKVPYEFWAKHAPPSVATDRYNAWLKSRSQPPSGQ